MSHVEILVWHRPEDGLPDDDTTVMIIAGGDIEAWPGYKDGDQWRSADGMPIESVVWWAHMPSGPTAEGEKG